VGGQVRCDGWRGTARDSGRPGALVGANGDQTAWRAKWRARGATKFFSSIKDIKVKSDRPRRQRRRTHRQTAPYPRCPTAEREREREEVVVASKDKWAALQGPWAADQRRSLFRLLRSFSVSLSILKISPHTGKSVHQVAQASSRGLPSRHVHRPPCYGSPNKRKGNHQHDRRRARH
jgi:hypothetical protein